MPAVAPEGNRTGGLTTALCAAWFSFIVAVDARVPQFILSLARFNGILLAFLYLI